MFQKLREATGASATTVHLQNIFFLLLLFIYRIVLQNK